MAEIANDASEMLTSARERGRRIMKPISVPQSLESLTLYVGLIESALELAKLIQTEERDLKIIEAHYSIEIARISAALRETEGVMQLAFDRDNSLRDKTFEVINALIEAGKHEIALKFYERMLDGFSKITLDSLIGRHNSASEAAGITIKRK